ncbi:MAG TPA: hypothetical protein VK541_18490 [Pedobacter sp.]|uniref:hypothetical protein n=1 Tax=Pedobacter sp. TaxID=1411316 RepID=UPI002BC422CF|nr:hypothetical protein [Pedobacter sp.]HMI04485.1 hypothetical protein [Pedobacter sp.]
MVQKILQLMVYRKSKRTSNLVFKSEDGEFRIEGMLDGMRLVAGLEQLRLAVIAGGGKVSWFELFDIHGNEWLLEVRCVNRVVAVQLWYKGKDDGVFTDFCWDGGVGEFDRAVRRLRSFEKIQ